MPFAGQEVGVRQEQVRQGLDEGVEDLRQKHPDSEHVGYRAFEVPLLQLGDGLAEGGGQRMCVLGLFHDFIVHKWIVRRCTFRTKTPNDSGNTEGKAELV